MEDIYIGTPNARQDEFLRCKKKYVAFGGARGGGKSWAVRCKAKLLAQRYPGIRMLLVRRTMPEIETNHLETLRLELAGTAVYRAEERRFVFGNGSVLQFGYCACDRDADRYQGAEYDVIFFDEATQLKEQWMRKLAACVRGVNGFPKRIYYTCNPGGPGHGYIKRLFIDRRYEPGENGGEYAFIPARVTDNGALLARQPEYIRQLEALPPKLRAAWLEGRWDVLAGQVFQEFTDDPAHYADRRWTHVIRPFDIPREWNVYRSYDFGYAKPFSFPAAGGRWTSTGACTGYWSCTAARERRTRACCGHRSGSSRRYGGWRTSTRICGDGPYGGWRTRPSGTPAGARAFMRRR